MSRKGNDYTTIMYSSSIPPVYLDFQLLNNELALNWTNGGFSLQTSPASTGTFTNLPGATSPFTNPITGAQQFFRLKKKQRAREYLRLALACQWGSQTATRMFNDSRDIPCFRLPADESSLTPRPFLRLIFYTRHE